jgi:oxygen-independent coproporphyrinogen III oxidase
MTAALYLHIPFCRRKCIYCDFYSETRTLLLTDFLPALELEIGQWKRRTPFSEVTFSTIYFGGGTPSLMHPDQVKRILDILHQSFHFSPSPEISLEANPGTVLARNLQGFRNAGVNRLTLGVQSFVDEELRFLTRIHSATEAVDAFHHVRDAGFDNIGLDLIFGIPGQTQNSWEMSLGEAIELHPEHLSLYGLTYEQNTPLWQQLTQGKIRRCPEETERNFFLQASTLTTEAGYEHYEIANYALPGKRSQHNQKYWDYSSYLGLGPSAHSFDGSSRWWNVRNVDEYINNCVKGTGAVQSSEEITMQKQAEEWILLGLRRREGIDLSAWQAAFGYDLWPIVESLAADLGGIDATEPFQPSSTAALFTHRGDRLGLTLQGVLLYDSICERLFDRLL